MKNIVVILIFINFCALAQLPDTILHVRKGSILDRSISNVYLYNNRSDTLNLTNVFANEYDERGSYKSCEVVKIDSIQINNYGRKELIFHRRCNLYANAHGGTFDIDKLKYLSKWEIWDLDKNKVLFESVNEYIHDDKTWTLNYSNNIYQHYKYDFEIDSLGVIKISNLDVVKDTADYRRYSDRELTTEQLKFISPRIKEIQPDHSEGEYVYKDGCYINSNYDIEFNSTGKIWNYFPRLNNCFSDYKNKNENKFSDKLIPDDLLFLAKKMSNKDNDAKLDSNQKYICKYMIIKSSEKNTTSNRFLANPIDNRVTLNKDYVDNISPSYFKFIEKDIELTAKEFNSSDYYFTEYPRNEQIKTIVPFGINYIVFHEMNIQYGQMSNFYSEYICLCEKKE